jgi:hypothetical protein
MFLDGLTNQIALCTLSKMMTAAITISKLNIQQYFNALLSHKIYVKNSHSSDKIVLLDANDLEGIVECLSKEIGNEEKDGLEEAPNIPKH